MEIGSLSIRFGKKRREGQMGNRQIEQNKNMVEFYVEEDRRTEVKDCFKLLRRLLEEQIEKYSGDMSLCDVGCATGDLIWYLSDCFKENAIKFCGVDVSEKLLDIARNRMTHVDFVQCDIMNTSDFSRKFDAVICFGVLSLFEDWKKFLLNLCNLSTRGGTLLYFCAI